MKAKRREADFGKSKIGLVVVGIVLVGLNWFTVGGNCASVGGIEGEDKVLRNTGIDTGGQSLGVSANNKGGEGRVDLSVKNSGDDDGEKIVGEMRKSSVIVTRESTTPGSLGNQFPEGKAREGGVVAGKSLESNSRRVTKENNVSLAGSEKNVLHGLEESMHILRDGGDGGSRNPKTTSDKDTRVEGVKASAAGAEKTGNVNSSSVILKSIASAKRNFTPKYKKIVKDADGSGKKSVSFSGGSDSRNFIASTRKYSSEDESSTLLVLRLAQCRANCLSKKLERIRKQVSTPSEDPISEDKINVFYDECWDTCLLLEIENGRNYPEHHHPSLPARFLDPGICNGNNSCLSGCQDACEFHDHVGNVVINGRKPPLLAATKVESFLLYNLSSSMMMMNGSGGGNKRKEIYQLDLSWPGRRGEVELPLPVVYSIVQHVRLKSMHPSWTWRLLEQTTLNKVSLSFAKKPKIGDIRVLGANSEKLVHVFSQEKRIEWENKLGKTAPEQQGQNGGGKAGGGKNEQNSHAPTADSAPSGTNSGQETEWHLRKVSMVHQKFLVVTEITWDLPPPQADKTSGAGETSGNQIREPEKGQEGIQRTEQGLNPNKDKLDKRNNFLLTWEVAGGILKGNMVTDTNSVTISLWPDTLYSIQVGLIEEDGEKKEGLGGLNPWEIEPEPKVILQSGLLVLNTSEAVLNDMGKSDDGNGASDEGDDRVSEGVKNVSNMESKQAVGRKSLRKIHHHRRPISSHHEAHHSREDEQGAGEEEDEEEDNEGGVVVGVGMAAEAEHHVRNLTFEGKLWKRCGGPDSGTLTTWLCQLSISALVIFGSIYGLLVLFSMLLYVFFAFRNYSYCGRSPSQFLSGSTSKLSLLTDASGEEEGGGSRVSGGKKHKTKSAKFNSSSQSLKILGEGVVDVLPPYQHFQDFQNDEPDIGRRKDFVSLYNIV